MDLEEIFRAHQREIFVYFLRTVGDPHLAEDLAQDTFLRACNAALLYRAEASIRTWLFAIARISLANHFRTKAPDVLTEPEEVSIEVDPGRRLEVEEALASLPLPHREAIVLCDVLGLEPSEAAVATGSTANAFRVRLHRARRAFREVYSDER